MAGFRKLLGRARRAIWRGVLVEPSLVIIGAQKAGTTALAHYLDQHPQVLRSTDKEVDYFGSNSRYPLGDEFYHSHFHFHFRSVPDRAVSFEASPHYLLVPEAARRIHDYRPDCKIICLLREPVSRAFSAFNMYRRFVEAEPDFFARWNRRCYTEAEASRFLPRPAEHLDDLEGAVRAEIEALSRGELYEWHLIPYGLYAKNLHPYLDVFPSQQVLLMGSSRLRDDTERALGEITEFLGLQSFDWSLADTGKKHAERYREPMAGPARELLEEYFETPNRELQRLIGEPARF